MRRITNILILLMLISGVSAEPYTVYTTSRAKYNGAWHGSLNTIGADAPLGCTSAGAYRVTTIGNYSVASSASVYSFRLSSVGRQSVGTTTHYNPITRRRAGFDQEGLPGVPDEPGKNPNNQFDQEFPTNPPEPPAPVGDWPVGLLLVMLVWYGVKKIRVCQE